MNRLLLALAALAALALTGCANLKFVSSLQERSTPQVSVSADQIRIAPEALYFFPDEKNVTIRWQLPASGRLRFDAQRGIEIEGRVADRLVPGSKERGEPALAIERNQAEVVKCAVSEDRLSASCLNVNSRPGIYKYTIRLRDGDRVLSRDPAIVNME